ncbi:MAG: helix-turn-helix domain-containing protein [Bacilli bacterium]|nr:helix-turn-helix domain-containing protein [Bacilli bacterium]
MDQVKIGKLIAECRKNKKLTQVGLAQKLGVSDKSVSKWENGKGLPDVSLYKPLCEILGITLNEFFAGEKIKDENYKKQADENLYKALKSSAFTLKERIE